MPPTLSGQYEQCRWQATPIVFFENQNAALAKFMLDSRGSIVNNIKMPYYYLYNIGKRIGRMEEPRNLEVALRERIKELNCWYGIARLAERNYNSLEDFLKSLVDFLPQSWQYPEVARCRIDFQGETFLSDEFKWTEWRQSAQILVGKELLGNVTISYREERPRADEGPFLKEERALLDGIAQRIGEFAVRLMAQQELQENNRQLLLERKALQEANAALRVVLSNIEEEKRRIYQNMRQNIDKVIMPILHALAPAVTRSKQTYVDILRNNLEEITSPFTNHFLNRFHSLTPTEVNICTLIRNGLRTKEIADLRGVSAATINRHREHIRKKLNIANQKVNLTTYLQSHQAEDSAPHREGA